MVAEGRPGMSPTTEVQSPAARYPSASFATRRLKQLNKITGWIDEQNL